MQTLKGGKPLVASGFAESCPMAVSPDGKRVALISRDELSEWSTETSKLVRSARTESEGSNRLFEYLDPTHIALAFEDAIAVYDMSAAKPKSVLIPTSGDASTKFAVSPGGRDV